jgi:calcineurin-like phosphoesterase family protein
MSIHFVSDTHWGHANIIRYSSRPYSSVQEMDEALIKNWNDNVKPDDIVWHLGDFAFMPYQSFKKMLWRLNGQINVVLGNHDKMIVQHREDLLMQGKIKSIQHYRELKVNGQLIVMFHYGLRTWRDNSRGSISLHGHSHGNLKQQGKSVDVGVDCKEITHEYRPIHIDEVITYMSKRKQVVVDHHGERDESE